MILQLQSDLNEKEGNFKFLDEYELDLQNDIGYIWKSMHGKKFNRTLFKMNAICDIRINSFTVRNI